MMRLTSKGGAHDPQPPEYADSAPNTCPEPSRGVRTFNLNSPEAYEILCPRQDERWIKAGSLPREPRVWEREVLREG